MCYFNSLVAPKGASINLAGTTKQLAPINRPLQSGFIYSNWPIIKGTAYNTIGSLVAPLVNRAAIKSQFNTAKTNQIEAMLNYQQTILDAYVDVVNDFTEIDHLEEIKQLTSLKSSSFEKAVESSFELYKAARVPYYDVLLSQQNALQTNIELILLHKRSKHSLVRLFKNLGGRWQ